MYILASTAPSSFRFRLSARWDGPAPEQNSDNFYRKQDISGVEIYQILVKYSPSVLELIHRGFSKSRENMNMIGGCHFAL